MFGGRNLIKVLDKSHSIYYSKKESVGAPVVGPEVKGECSHGESEVVLYGLQVQLVVGGGADVLSVLSVS